MKPDDDLLPEYDFTGAVRGKYYERYQKDTSVVTPKPDVPSEPEPEKSESAQHARRLVEAGAAHWSGGKPEGSRQKPRPRGKNASDIVLEDRR
jgi:hypothetical protein